MNAKAKWASSRLWPLSSTKQGYRIVRRVAAITYKPILYAAGMRHGMEGWADRNVTGARFCWGDPHTEIGFSADQGAGKVGEMR